MSGSDDVEEPGADLESEVGELMDPLVQTSFTLMALLSRVAAAHDLSLTQLRVLAILRDREPKLSEVADHLGLERSSVSGLIDRAVARGLVRREASVDDRRAVRLSLTAEGRRLDAPLTGEVAAVLAPLTGKLTAAEQRRLAALLQKLLA
jgi:DNA-binding MarR family transcriptional regulator